MDQRLTGCHTAIKSTLA